MFKIIGIVTPPTERTFTLEMSESDAVLLRRVCHMIGGDQTKSPRGVMDNLAHVLGKEGIEKPITNDDIASGTIYFKNYPGAR